MRAPIVLAALPAASLAAPAQAQATTQDVVARGRALFLGQATTEAPVHLRGETRALPASAVRCINCHVAPKGAEPLGPRLTADTLLTMASRRGGPASAYDRDSFCRVLGNSVDNTGVVLAKAMPQYQLSDPECTALWSYLLTQ
nr:hypothetical protein [uncultured Cupriavidus sp.]